MATLSEDVYGRTDGTTSVTWTGGPSTSIALAVAAVTERPQDQLRPLYDVVDPDALDTLARHSAGDLDIEFRYEGCSVHVDGKLVRVVAGEERLTDR